MEVTEEQDQVLEDEDEPMEDAGDTGI